jgi:hypothetical protein
MSIKSRIRTRRAVKRARKAAAGTVALMDVFASSRQARAYQKLARDRAITEALSAARVDAEGFPERAFASGGKQRRHNLRSSFRLRPRPFHETAFSFASAYPFLAGANLGHQGAYIGEDVYGGGAFVFDPWELYRAKVITGMSMILMGAVGSGKSTCAKSLVVRLVLLGRKALILADRKGEWDVVARFVGGHTIKVGPGQPDRVNPLDAGIRPSTTPDGEPMTDARWAAMVRARRLNLLQTIGEILLDRRVQGAEHTALSMALDTAVRLVAPGVPTLPVFIDQLRDMATSKDRSATVAEAAERLLHAFARTTEGDLAGMFDGETTAYFDPDAPIITVNTKALTGASREARKIAYACTGSWAESMVTNADSGQRLCVYEEGWDSVSDEASLTRMMEAWKLARDYGIFNILIIHKLADLAIAGDAGSAMAAMARSLLGDTEVKVIYRQETANLDDTQKELGLTEAERKDINGSEQGTGLWKVGSRTASVRNKRTTAEIPVFDTDGKTRGATLGESTHGKRAAA